MTPSDEVRKLLDEHGLKYTIDYMIDDSNDYEITEWQGQYNLWWQFLYDPYEEAPYGELRLLDTGGSTHLTPEQAIAATVGRSCESCPEMDNPDSYIRHLQSALKWHDEHVPRPTNPRNTCAVLQGSKPPEEVLFVGPDGVTHYQPEGTCEWCKDGKTFDGQTVMMTNHGWEKIRHCPRCGRRIEVDE